MDTKLVTWGTILGYTASGGIWDCIDMVDDLHMESIKSKGSDTSDTVPTFFCLL